uniref:Uncharacterized protein n=1 Tax=Steinernema glaseri TaxID=37863 RepID=A0A1I8A862_9BILA
MPECPSLCRRRNYASTYSPQRSPRPLPPHGSRGGSAADRHLKNFLGLGEGRSSESEPPNKLHRQIYIHILGLWMLTGHPKEAPWLILRSKKRLQAPSCGVPSPMVMLQKKESGVIGRKSQRSPKSKVESGETVPQTKLTSLQKSQLIPRAQNRSH